MSDLKFDTIDQIEQMMPQIHAMLSQDTKSLGVGPRVVAPLAEAIVTLARELRLLRESLGQQKTP